MKMNFSKAFMLTLGLGLAVSLTSCHSGSDEEVAQVTTNISPRHSIRGTILDGNGQALTGASVTMSRQGSASTQVVSVVDNHFEVTGLADGTWNIIVTKNGYKTDNESITLAVTTQTVEGKSVRVGQNVDQVFYLNQEVKSKSIKLGGETSASDEITIETTKQDDGTGKVVNTTDPTGDQTTAETITVEAETPAITGDDYTDIEDQLKDQGYTIDDFSMYLVNITSLEDAKELAEEAEVAGSRAITRATTDLPGGRELLAGVGLNAGPVVLNLPGNLTIAVTIRMPDENSRGAVTLYRTINGESWLPLTENDPDVASIVTSGSNIIVYLKVLRTQSIALGVQIQETSGAIEMEDISYVPVVNNNATALSVPSMKYTVKEGVVLQNTVQGALTDFLRKVILRKYGVRAVNNVTEVQKTYAFTPAYSLPAYGTLWLFGYQQVSSKTYSVLNANASFTAREYGETLVYPYATYPETETTHVGGGN